VNVLSVDAFINWIVKGADFWVHGIKGWWNIIEVKTQSLRIWFSYELKKLHIVQSLEDTSPIIDPGIFDESSTAIQSVHYTKKSLDFPVLVHLV